MSGELFRARFKIDKLDEGGKKRMTNGAGRLIPLRTKRRSISPGFPSSGRASMMNGDPRQWLFAEQLRLNQVQVFGYIYSLVRNFDDADDLFQQTSLAMWNKFEQFDQSRSFVAWACGVARFEVSNFLRARSRQKLYFSDDLSLLLAESQDPGAVDSSEDQRAALAGCLGKLRQRDQKLVTACYGEESLVPEVARAWGRSAQSIHNSLRRIRRSLFECVRRSVDLGVSS